MEFTVSLSCGGLFWDVLVREGEGGALCSEGLRVTTMFGGDDGVAWKRVRGDVDATLRAPHPNLLPRSIRIISLLCSRRSERRIQQPRGRDVLR